MEALGTVIDFEDGVAKFKILDLHDYPLYTLKAGHYGVDLCSRRPFRLGEDRRFRVVGKNGPVEIPMKLSEWVGRKFRQPRSVCLVEGENLVSEHALNDQFVTAAASARASSNKLEPVRENVPRAPVAADAPKHRKMAAYARANLGPRTLALVGFASLACALPGNSLPALAPPRGYQPAEVEGGLPRDGPTWSLSAALAAESGPQRIVHGLEPGLDGTVPEPVRPRVLLSRGRNGDPGYKGNPRSQGGTCEADPECHRRSSKLGTCRSRTSCKPSPEPMNLKL